MTDEPLHPLLAVVLGMFVGALVALGAPGVLGCASPERPRLSAEQLRGLFRADRAWVSALQFVAAPEPCRPSYQILSEQRVECRHELHQSELLVDTASEPVLACSCPGPRVEP
jgi:hypothetical protein